MILHWMWKPKSVIFQHIFLADSESILKQRKTQMHFVDIEAVYDFGSYTYTIPKEELTKMAYVSSDGSIQISRSNVEAYVGKI